MRRYVKNFAIITRQSKTDETRLERFSSSSYCSHNGLCPQASASAKAASSRDAVFAGASRSNNLDMQLSKGEIRRDTMSVTLVSSSSRCARGLMAR